MTCTIGLIKENKIYFAADSLGSSSFSKSTYANAKIFKAVNTNDFLIGIAGTFNTQVMNYLPIFDELTYAKGQIDRKYMITELPLTLRSLKDTYDPHGKGEFTTIMGYDGFLYKTQMDGSVLLVADDFVCLGSGEEIAKGAMETILRQQEVFKFDMSPQEILFTALDIAQKFVPSVQEPFLCINDSDDEIWYYEDNEMQCLNPSPNQEKEKLLSEDEGECSCCNCSLEFDDEEGEENIDEEIIQEVVQRLKKQNKNQKVDASHVE